MADYYFNESDWWISLKAIIESVPLPCECCKHWPPIPKDNYKGLFWTNLFVISRKSQYFCRLHYRNASMYDILPWPKVCWHYRKKTRVGNNVSHAKQTRTKRNLPKISQEDFLLPERRWHHFEIAPSTENINKKRITPVLKKSSGERMI